MIKMGVTGATFRLRQEPFFLRADENTWKHHSEASVIVSECSILVGGGTDE